MKHTLIPSDADLKSEYRIINWFIENPVAANLLMVFTLIGGLYMVGFFGLFGQTSKIPLEAFPLVESNTVTVSASLNGSSPEDVEKGVTNKIEEALSGVQGVDEMLSTSTANSAKIVITAEEGYNLDDLLEDVKTEVNALSGLPAEVEKIRVTKNARQRSILWVTLYGDASEIYLKQLARDLKSELLASRYVQAVKLDGEKSGEIAIEIPEDKLNAYGLTLSQVATAIAASSIDLSAGSIETAQGQQMIRLKNQADKGVDYENIVIRRKTDGSAIYLRDVAVIKDGLAEDDIFTEFNGKPSITLRLYSGEHANVIEADADASKIIHDFAAKLPKTLAVTIWNNRVTHVRDRIDLFVNNAGMGIVLVFLLLTLFLNLSLALWVAIGIPISFAGALLMMGQFHISINLITLFGFIVVLGIIVDDAIVIGESVYTWKKRLNNAEGATLRGTARVSTAATFGVLTTVAAFLPLTQVSGNMGNILGQIGWVVIFCLLFSLVESKLILPAHLRHVKVVNESEKPTHLWAKLQHRIAEGLERLVEKCYLPLLKRALLQRYFCLLLFIAMLILILGTVIGGKLRINRFPSIEAQDISLTVEMDTGTDVKTTQALARKAADALRLADANLVKEKGLKTTNVTDIVAFNTSDTTFMVRAGLKGAQARSLSAETISNAWRQQLGAIVGAKSVSFAARQRFSRSDIDIQLLGHDAKQQQAAAQDLMALLPNFLGVVDVFSSEDQTSNEIHLQLKPEASAFGITHKMLIETVRAAFYGVEAERILRDGEEIRVIVRYPKNERESLSRLSQLRIHTANGLSLPISSLATLSFQKSPQSISHLNGERVVSIFANINRSLTTSEAVLAGLHDDFKRIASTYGVKVKLGGEAAETEKSDNSMKVGFLASLLMIYLLLAIPLKSYSEPLLIMSVIPFGIIGAIAGHLLLGMDFSMVGSFGVIALSGVVVNDSLLLVSTIKQHQQEGMSLPEAISYTGLRRFRPVILTSITTFVGLLPMLFETSFQAQFLIPMAVSLGFGILFATVITLILVPVLYLIFDDIKRLFWLEKQ